MAGSLGLPSSPCPCPLGLARKFLSHFGLESESEHQKCHCCCCFVAAVAVPAPRPLPILAAGVVSCQCFSLSCRCCRHTEVSGALPRRCCGKRVLWSPPPHVCCKLTVSLSGTQDLQMDPDSTHSPSLSLRPALSPGAPADHWTVPRNPVCRPAAHVHLPEEQPPQSQAAGAGAAVWGAAGAGPTPGQHPHRALQRQEAGHSQTPVGEVDPR